MVTKSLLPLIRKAIIAIKNTPITVGGLAGKRRYSTFELIEKAREAGENLLQRVAMYG